MTMKALAKLIANLAKPQKLFSAKPEILPVLT
jgi:hypothetical protein